MAPDAAPVIDATEKADTADGGWTVESASVPPEVETPPVAPAIPAVRPAPLAAREDDEDREEAPAAAGPDGAEKVSRRVRKAQRYEEMERAKGEAERTADTARRENETLRKRLEALERGDTAATVVPPKPDVAPVGPARCPKLSEFDSEEAFDEALEKWHQDGLVARETALRNTLTGEVETRLERERTERAQAESQRRFEDRLRAVGEAHPDLKDKIAAHADVFAGITADKAPFLFDVISNTDTGAELLPRFADRPDLAEALAELPIPTRPLRDAVVRSSVPELLMEHFATRDGREEYLQLRTLHPVDAIRAIGALEARLSAATSGSAGGAPEPITSAVPSVRPPVGSPRARDVSSSAAPPPDFEKYMADEDAKDLAAKLKRIGATA